MIIKIKHQLGPIVKDNHYTNIEVLINFEKDNLKDEKFYLQMYDSSVFETILVSFLQTWIWINDSDLYDEKEQVKVYFSHSSVWSDLVVNLSKWAATDYRDNINYINCKDENFTIEAASLRQLAYIITQPYSSTNRMKFFYRKSNGFLKDPNIEYSIMDYNNAIEKLRSRWSLIKDHPAN